jgi:hypothetical protein
MMGKITIQLKAIRIDLHVERIELYLRLREAFDFLSSLINDEAVDLKIRLKAIQLLGYIAQTAMGILSDETVDEIERLVEEVKKRKEELDREREKMKISAGGIVT